MNKMVEKYWVVVELLSCYWVWLRRQKIVEMLLLSNLKILYLMDMAVRKNEYKNLIQ